MPEMPIGIVLVLRPRDHIDSKRDGISLTTGEDILQPSQSQMGGCVVRIPFVSSSFMLFPWCRIDRFQSLAVSRPDMYWNSFGVIHVSCSPPQLIQNFQLKF